MNGWVFDIDGRMPLLRGRPRSEIVPEFRSCRFFGGRAYFIPIPLAQSL